jgi:hypothetical protein
MIAVGVGMAAEDVTRLKPSAKKAATIDLRIANLRNTRLMPLAKKAQVLGLPVTGRRDITAHRVTRPMLWAKKEPDGHAHLGTRLMLWARKVDGPSTSRCGRSADGRSIRCPANPRNQVPGSPTEYGYFSDFAAG